MKVAVIRECGYEEAVLGFSLSYNTSIERAKEILPKYAFGVPGENKFLESITIWLDITAPRYWWQEYATYRVGTSTQSESTMHTITKRLLTVDDFEYGISDTTLDELNSVISLHNDAVDSSARTGAFLRLKSILPEGFLQRRISSTNYKCLQNMYHQRKKHKLPQWSVIFCPTVVSEIEHPEFIVKE